MEPVLVGTFPLVQSALSGVMTICKAEMTSQDEPSLTRESLLYKAKSMTPQSSEHWFVTWCLNTISYDAYAAPSKFLLVLLIVLK